MGNIPVQTKHIMIFFKRHAKQRRQRRELTLCKNPLSLVTVAMSDKAMPLSHYTHNLILPSATCS